MATTISKFLEGSDFSILSQAETIWKTNPDTGGTTGSWDTMLVTDFAPNYTPTRQRPPVIKNDQQVSPSVRTQIACTPATTVPFTRTLFNPWIAALINNDSLDTWATNKVQNATAFQSFHLLQKQQTGDDNYAYPGCWPMGGTFTLATGAFSTFAFNWFAGSRAKIAAAAIIDPINPAPTTPIFSPIETTTTVLLGGAAVAGAFSATIVFAKDGAEQLYVIGDPTAKSIAVGALNITGTLQLYTEDTSIFDLFDGETKQTLVIQIRDDEAKGYNFSMPEVILSTYDDPISGPGPITATANYEANPNPHTIEIEEIV